MANMSYCRFENTESDLSACMDHLTDKLSEREHASRERIVELAREIVKAANEGEIPEDPRED